MEASLEQYFLVPSLVPGNSSGWLDRFKILIENIVSIHFIHIQTGPQ